MKLEANDLPCLSVDIELNYLGTADLFDAVQLL